MIPMSDIHWLAGLLEGEGHFSMETSNYKYHYPRIKLKMTDKDVVDRAGRLLGKTTKPVSRTGVPAHHKDQWVVDMAGKKAAVWMMTLYSLMGERRKAKIKSILVASPALNNSAVSGARG